MKTKTLALILCIVMVLAFIVGTATVVFGDGVPTKVMVPPLLLFLLSLMVYRRAK